MTSREETINQAIDALTSGTATPPDGQDPQALADSLRERSEGGTFGQFAAYKDAQSILPRS